MHGSQFALFNLYRSWGVWGETQMLWLYSAFSFRNGYMGHNFEVHTAHICISILSHTCTFHSEQCSCITLSEMWNNSGVPANAKNVFWIWNCVLQSTVHCRALCATEHCALQSTVHCRALCAAEHCALQSTVHCRVGYFRNPELLRRHSAVKVALRESASSLHTSLIERFHRHHQTHNVLPWSCHRQT